MTDLQKTERLAIFLCEKLALEPYDHLSRDKYFKDAAAIMAHLGEPAQAAPKYATLKEWLNEIDGYGLRAERIPPGAYPWIAEAWKLGAASSLPSTTLGGEAREKEITRLATIEECARLAENTGLRNPENIARDIRALALTSTSRGGTITPEDVAWAESEIDKIEGATVPPADRGGAA